MRKLTEILGNPLKLGDATISEGDGERVIVSGLTAAVSQELRFELKELGWKYQIEDQFERVLDESEEAKAANEPYMLAIHKPTSTRRRFLTPVGFISWLENKPAAEVVEVAECIKPFSTEMFVVCGWGSEANIDVRASDELRSPREIVRDQSEGRVPNDLRPLLLKRGSSFEWADKIFQAWANVAGEKLCCSLASVVYSDGRMRFGGPPVLDAAACRRDEFSQLTAAGFKALQESVRWVFENPVEAETKHGFISIEIARSPNSLAGSSPYGLFSSILMHAFESAMLAHKLNLSKISGDTLRALSDLRKALADEASKASDVARQVYSGTAAAVFASIGVAIARSTGNASVFAVRALAVVVGIYLLGLAASAFFQRSSQDRMRGTWRSHLYRFLSDADYKSLVSDPAEAASLPLKVGAWLAGVAAIVMFLVLWFLPFHQA